MNGELTERERAILDMWPRFEDGEPVWLGDAVEARHGGAITIEAIEFSRGKVCVKDAEDGDWDTSMYAMHPLKRPVQSVLDADGVPIREGDTVWIIPECCDTPEEPHKVRRINRWREVLLEFHTEGSTGVKGEYLTHARPDSWERLEEDAAKHPCDYAEVVKGREFSDCVDCPWWGECGGRSESELMARDIIRRAKKLAGVER